MESLTAVSRLYCVIIVCFTTIASAIVILKDFVTSMMRWQNTSEPDDDLASNFVGKEMTPAVITRSYKAIVSDYNIHSHLIPVFSPLLEKLPVDLTYPLMDDAIDTIFLMADKKSKAQPLVASATQLPIPSTPKLEIPSTAKPTIPSNGKTKVFLRKPLVACAKKQLVSSISEFSIPLPRKPAVLSSTKPATASDKSSKAPPREPPNASAKVIENSLSDKSSKAPPREPPNASAKKQLLLSTGTLARKPTVSSVKRPRILFDRKLKVPPRKPSGATAERIAAFLVNGIDNASAKKLLPTPSNVLSIPLTRKRGILSDTKPSISSCRKVKVPPKKPPVAPTKKQVVMSVSATARKLLAMPADAQSIPLIKKAAILPATKPTISFGRKVKVSPKKTPVSSSKKLLPMPSNVLSIPLTRKRAILSDTKLSISSCRKVKVPPKKPPVAPAEKQVVMSVSAMSISLARKPAILSAPKSTVPFDKISKIVLSKPVVGSAKKQVVLSTPESSKPLARKPAITARWRF